MLSAKSPQIRTCVLASPQHNDLFSELKNPRLRAVFAAFVVPHPFIHGLQHISARPVNTPFYAQVLLYPAQKYSPLANPERRFQQNHRVRPTHSFNETLAPRILHDVAIAALASEIIPLCQNSWRSP